jgi:uncharacterized protein YdbL (DUF1318 family)
VGSLVNLRESLEKNLGVKHRLELRDGQAKNEIEVLERLSGYLTQMKNDALVARALADEGLSPNPRQWFTDRA